MRGPLNKLVSRSLSVAGKWQQQLRRLNVHEYQVAVSSVDEVKKALQDVFPNHSESQVLAGGRGLGKFKNEKMLGQILVTKQTGPQGKIVSKMYFAIMLDRTTAGPFLAETFGLKMFIMKGTYMIILFQLILPVKGGTSIEDLAEKFPDLIIKVPIDVFKGITDEDAVKVVDGSPKIAERKNASNNLMVPLQINPIAETSDKKLVAADAKLNFDDNAAFRQKEIFALRDPTQEDPREVAAAKADLNYIGLDGEIGCMVNGAGLVMATMDIINCMEELLPISGLKAILVNIFGGIMKCDVALKVPVVVRLEGTNVDQGKRILKESGMTLITAEDLDDAADKAVKHQPVEISRYTPN
ncbi:hypothetical protein K2173_011542 [Erythroxylum novogranatense]|uniref:Uncharacterized protein n=1 Tax=Erythroxylum novogranatense TaxID=1862640 RepID=A0AAV8S703_9ROSI|nr:hypothetical protein K2173_011542 [Erythroxylum novogranatense]